MAKKTPAEKQQDKLINLQAQQLAAQVANWAAQLEFQKERMRLLELPEMQGKQQIDIDRLAFDKGQAAWENAFKEATLTGTYQGQPTTEWLTQQAQLTGVLNGQQTLQGKLTDAQVAQMNAQMKLANDEFVTNATGYYNGQKTFDREKFEASQASDAWKFIASLTGPSNAFKQARAIGSMPGGISDLMNAWAGKYTMPGSTSVGSGGRASLGGLLEGNGGGPALPYTYGSGQMPVPTYTAPPSAVPPPTFPATPGNAAPAGTIPGRGFDPSQWNAATHSAVATWNASHPGYVADGSAVGYHLVAPATTVGTQPIIGDPVSAPKLAVPPATHVGIEPIGDTGGNPGGGTKTAQWTTTGDTGGNAGAQSNLYVYTPAGVQANANQWNYSQNTDGSIATYPPGTYSPASTPDVSSPTAVSPATAANVYHFGAPQPKYGDPGYSGPFPTQDPYTIQDQNPNSYGTRTEFGGSTVLPNQIDARNYANTSQYAKDLAWANYEDQGWDKGLAQETFQRSLPQYTGPKAGSFAF